MNKVPAPTIVWPKKLLVPVTVHAPVPAFTTVALPRPTMGPLKVLEVLSKPTDNLAKPRLISPLPETEPTLLEVVGTKSSRPSLFKVTAEPGSNWPGWSNATTAELAGPAPV